SSKFFGLLDVTKEVFANFKVASDEGLRFLAGHSGLNTEAMSAHSIQHPKVNRLHTITLFLGDLIEWHTIHLGGGLLMEIDALLKSLDHALILRQCRSYPQFNLGVVGRN